MVVVVVVVVVVIVLVVVVVAVVVVVVVLVVVVVVVAVVVVVVVTSGSGSGSSSSISATIVSALYNSGRTRQYIVLLLRARENKESGCLGIGAYRTVGSPTQGLALTRITLPSCVHPPTNPSIIANTGPMRTFRPASALR